MIIGFTYAGKDGIADAIQVSDNTYKLSNVKLDGNRRDDVIINIDDQYLERILFLVEKSND